MRYFKFGCTLLGILIFFNCNKNRSEAVQLITATEMKEISEIEGIQLVDVRTPDEYKEGHLPNAINIDFLDENFEINIQQGTLGTTGVLHDLNLRQKYIN